MKPIRTVAQAGEACVALLAACQESLVLVSWPCMHHRVMSFIGLHVRRKPDFEDYSCTMVFGERPPALGDDEVWQQGCLADCSMRRPGLRCHSLQ